jgi:hypothetical protein
MVRSHPSKNAELTKAPKQVELWFNESTIDDFRYSKFTHNWSGVAVCLLGMTWMAQGMEGSVGLWASRLSLVPLMGFGLFVGLAANPELWLLHRVSPAQLLANPNSLEYHLAAFTVLILAFVAKWSCKPTPILEPVEPC